MSVCLDGLLLAYFEIYDLEVDRDSTSHYQISYQVAARELGEPMSGKRERVFVTATFASAARTRNPVEELRIDVGALEESVYDLVIRVQDLGGGGETVASTPFSIVRP